MPDQGGRWQKTGGVACYVEDFLPPTNAGSGAKACADRLLIFGVAHTMIIKPLATHPHGVINIAQIAQHGAFHDVFQTIKIQRLSFWVF